MCAEAPPGQTNTRERAEIRAAASRAVRRLHLGRWEEVAPALRYRVVAGQDRPSGLALQMVLSVPLAHQGSGPGNDGLALIPLAALPAERWPVDGPEIERRAQANTRRHNRPAPSMYRAHGFVVVLLTGGPLTSGLAIDPVFFLRRAVPDLPAPSFGWWSVLAPGAAVAIVRDEREPQPDLDIAAARVVAGLRASTPEAYPQNLFPLGQTPLSSHLSFTSPTSG